MADTTNATGFAHCYMRASAYLMDAIANPSEAAFDDALKQARRARRDSFVPGDNYVGSELHLADSLADAIIAAALYHGYRM